MNDKYFDLLRCLDFCPIEMTFNNGQKILCTRCWEWLGEKMKGFNVKSVPPDKEDVISVWDLDKNKMLSVKLSDIKSHGLSNYKGAIYLK